jgi:hypothetical protein
VAPHIGRGKEIDVFQRLLALYETLPRDEGHAKMPQEPCCDETLLNDDDRGEIDRKAARRFLLRR